MGKVTGFLEHERLEEGYVPVAKRVKNYQEFVIALAEDEAKVQAEIVRITRDARLSRHLYRPSQERSGCRVQDGRPAERALAPAGRESTIRPAVAFAAGAAGRAGAFGAAATAASETSIEREGRSAVNVMRREPV